MQTKYTYKQIWLIAYPILISLLMEQMIGMTDTAFLGRVGEVELGASAIAGVFYMVIFIGALQEVPIELYEAAKVDGANAWQRLTKITVPMIKNTTYLVLTFGMINAFQIFDQIAAMSKQSPLGSPSGATSTLVTFLYQQSFSYMDMGYGSAAAVVLFLIIFSLSAVRETVGRRSD